MFVFQVRDSLAQTLNTEIMDTIQKLDKIGKTEASVFQKGGHVAHVTVSDSAHAQEAGHYSSGTSGVYSSVEGSEGSNSPEYNSWRSRVQPHPASTQRWSIQGEPNKVQAISFVMSLYLREAAVCCYLLIIVTLSL